LKNLRMLLACAYMIVLLTVFVSNRAEVAKAEVFTDPVADLFDREGRPAVAEPYLDIVEVEAAQSGVEYTARIKVNGPLPSGLSDPAIFIEWELLVDIDQDRLTHPWGSWPLLDNGIGVDVLIRLMLGPRGQGYRAEIRDLTRNRRMTIAFKVEGASMELKYNSTSFAVPKAFDYIYAVRKFGNYGASGGELACDKAPNEGYFTFSDGKVLLVTPKPVKTGQPTEKLETKNAIVYHNLGNEEKAKWYGEAFEYAYLQVGNDLGAYPAKQFKLYAYLTQEDLVLGLQLYSGFSADAASYFKTSGAPRPINYVMHISPGFDWHTIIHEYTHTIIEELSGKVYQSMKWLDEGLAEYEAYVTVIKTKYNQTDFRLKADAMRQVYDALDNGKLFSLGELSSDTDWHNRLPGTPERSLQYAQAWVLVNYLAVTYGPAKCKSILLTMRQGETQESALRSQLGVPMTQFETDFKQYLQKIRTDAPVRIAEAEAAVKKAESEGRTVGLTQARTMIQEAKDMMVTSDYERALTLADRAKELASRATAPQVTATTTPSTGITTQITTAAPSATTTYAVAGLVAVVVVTALLALRLRKKS